MVSFPSRPIFPTILTIWILFAGCGAGAGGESGMVGKTSVSDQAVGEQPDLAQLGIPEGTFVVLVLEDGSIHVSGAEVTEETMLDQAAMMLEEDPDTNAVLLVRSSQIQGIHLTARLSEMGYRNVTVYYPTATQD